MSNTNLLKSIFYSKFHFLSVLGGIVTFFVSCAETGQTLSADQPYSGRIFFKWSDSLSQEIRVNKRDSLTPLLQNILIYEIPKMSSLNVYAYLQDENQQISMYSKVSKTEYTLYYQNNKTKAFPYIGIELPVKDTNLLPYFDFKMVDLASDTLSAHVLIRWVKNPDDSLTYKRKLNL